ncbi:putative mitochondrial protein [Cucumis melo var. makuwa]|uniref:Mitochondrial protein n=1 Tax=Cucumis melo var. makuwa TaxID=1194695 RepID=A0A5A7UFS3_CUCMM|nr:putative mitochondrial protein [Cucumis melo var. makuwa]TYK09417.1 putative mitochondrial protein [Cucumis melo var. makuwa]
MEEEFEALQKNDTWRLTPQNPNQKIVGCKWVFKIKRNSYGPIARYKARLVAKGFHQTPNIDYNETFSPVVKSITICMLLTIAIMKGWSIRQLDVNNAFLHGNLDENVYMEQIFGFEVKSSYPMVCHLKKALYGLKQAPRAWYENLSLGLHSLGFRTSKADTSLLIRVTPTSCCYALIYVDDLIIMGSSKKDVNSLVHSLNSQFALKDLGKLSYFLGVEVSYPTNGDLFLSQSKYITDLLQRTKMLDAKPISTPMVSGPLLSAFQGEPFHDVHLLRSVVGALQYATLTHPEISYSVNKACQFMHTPKHTHWQLVKRILRYLKGVLYHGLWLSKSDNTSLVGFADADWASDPDDRKSTSGLCVYFGNNLVSWGSKKQSIISRSSTEAEYRCLALLATEMVWIRSLLNDLYIDLPFPPILCCDNLSAVHFSANPILHSKTKHVELDIYFVRDLIRKEKLFVRHLPATEQIADILTKPLSAQSFHKLKNNITVIDSAVIGLQGVLR